MALAADRYAGFGPTLVSEYLARERGLQLSAETLRQWRIGAGPWKTRAQRATVHRDRSRRPRFGELIQVDGSPHNWFEGRGPRCTMMVFIDDATFVLTYARLVPVEKWHGRS